MAAAEREADRLSEENDAVSLVECSFDEERNSAIAARASADVMGNQQSSVASANSAPRQQHINSPHVGARACCGCLDRHTCILI